MTVPEDVLDLGRDPRWRIPGPMKILVMVMLGVVVLTVALVQADRPHNRVLVPPASVPVQSPLSTAPILPRSATYADFGCEAASCRSGVVPAVLRRPLRTLRFAGLGCPSAPERVVVPDFGPAGGRGPVYSVGGDPKHHSTFNVAVPPPADNLFAGTGYGAQTIFWLIAPSYRGPVLIRGNRLDGATPVLFSFADGPLLTDVQLPPVTGSAPHQWRELSIYTRLAAAGCYYWQIDGTNFSYSVPFQVTTYP